VVLPIRNLLLHLDHLYQTEHQFHADSSRRTYAEVHLQPLCVLGSLHHIKPNRTVLHHFPVQAGVVRCPDPAR
jgi:hypothetical protein